MRRVPTVPTQGEANVDCVDFVDLVTDFLDGAMPQEQERRFVEHLAECSGC